MRDLAQELQDEVADGSTPAWIPEVGDVLVGKVVEYWVGKGYRGRDVHVATIEAEGIEDGSPFVAVWLSHAVLLDEFRKIRPAPGERIGIARLSDGEPEDGASYYRYRVKMDRGAEAIPSFDAPVAAD